MTIPVGSTAITSWSSLFTLPSGAKITNLWNGALAGSGLPYTVANLAYNGAVAAGRLTNDGFTGSGATPSGTVPVTCTAG